MGTNVLSCISPATMITKRERPTGVKWKYRVYGTATGTRSGTTQYGEWVSLTGEFEAIDFENGEISVAPECFLPSGLSEMIAGKLPTPEKPQTLLFDVGIKPTNRAEDEGKADKYEYCVRAATTEAQEADTRKRLVAIPFPPGVPEPKLLPPA